MKVDQEVLPWHGLWIQSRDDSEILANAMEDVARHPQIIAHRYTYTRPNLEEAYVKHIFIKMANSSTNLEFPLGWHNFSVRSANFDAGIQASAIVSIDNVASDDLIGSDTAIIRPATKSFKLLTLLL